jgi:RNA polymerase sigma factor (sigma-70 family)
MERFMRALQQLTRHLLSPPPSESDALLLAQLAGRQTDPALRVLMHRYGGLVLGVAQRVLRDAHLAEDAYQATFLVLVRKAGTVRHSLPAWLHRVALRLSLRMKSRLKPTVELPDPPATQQPHPVEQADVLGVIDEEIARLPTRLRAVVQWCYLNDATTAHAAEQLGIPRGTVLSRLDAARRKLQAALTRRGLTNLAILTVPILGATVSTALAERTTATILAYLSGATGPLVSLTTQEILSMTATHWMKMLGIGLMATGLGTSLVWLATPTAVQAQVQGVEKPKPPTEAKKPNDEKPEQKVKIAVVMKRLETINDGMQRLEFELKMTKERQLDESTFSDFTLRKLIEEIEMKILGGDLQYQSIEMQLKTAKTSPSEAEYIKQIESDTNIDQIYAKLPRIRQGGWGAPADTGTSISQLRDRKQSMKKKFDQMQLKPAEHSQRALEISRLDVEESEKQYQDMLKESAKRDAPLIVKRDQELAQELESRLAKNSEAKKALTTQRKEYIRALAKLTDNTETTKIQNQLDILRDQQALLSRVLLRLELEAQGITITPEDVPVKKEK